MFRELEGWAGMGIDGPCDVAFGWLYYDLHDDDAENYFTRGIQILFPGEPRRTMCIDLEAKTLIRTDGGETYVAFLAHHPEFEPFGFFGETQMDAVDAFVRHCDVKDTITRNQRQKALSRIKPQE